jgi:RNA polymerase sigma-70 factor (ECF subfamily)
MEHSNYLQPSETAAISDHEVIARVLKGEKDLYAIIIRRYNARLYRVGMSIINDDAEVEDIMQVAYIKAYESLGKFAFRSSFSTWLTRILINESLLRLKKRKLSLHLNDLMMNNEIPSFYPADAQTPASKTLNAELKTILEEAIRQLPEIYRTVFVMREIENMNIMETKECLEISEANVKVRLNRAKTLLKESLSRYYNKEDILHFHLSRCDRMVENVFAQLKALNIY